MSALCGNCARGRLAVLPDGSVAPCVIGRFLPTGNVKDGGLAPILADPGWAKMAAGIPPRTTNYRHGCPPNDSDACGPSDNVRVPPVAVMGGCPPNDSNDCNPANTEACGPSY
ncbi:SPASM domain-containing protein [Kitasatospora sp. NPDC059327]|uniref:SPASM domain-containing protein n=1 Tax=Kitasatospora sp. NPDC059327 TaxID=3346803 RepID=UPI0036CDBE39